jgi:hypothetical protein
LPLSLLTTLFSLALVCLELLVLPGLHLRATALVHGIVGFL